jgi:hypothetical protein
MQDFQDRVVVEKTELDHKIERLRSFVNGRVFSSLDGEEQQRMTIQLSYMDAYSEILGQRIGAFK